jgi:hypothetical protein
MGDREYGGEGRALIADHYAAAPARPGGSPLHPLPTPTPQELWGSSDPMSAHFCFNSIQVNLNRTTARQGPPPHPRLVLVVKAACYTKWRMKKEEDETEA